MIQSDRLRALVIVVTITIFVAPVCGPFETLADSISVRVKDYIQDLNSSVIGLRIEAA